MRNRPPLSWSLSHLSSVNPSLALGELGMARPHESHARLSGERPGSPNREVIAFPRPGTEMCASCLQTFQQAAQTLSR